MRCDLLHVLCLRGTLCCGLLLRSLSLYGSTLISDTTTSHPLWFIPWNIIHRGFSRCESIRNHRRGIFWRILTISCFWKRNDSEIPRPTPLHMIRAQNWWCFWSNLKMLGNFKFKVVRNKSFRQIIRYFPYFLHNLP